MKKNRRSKLTLGSLTTKRIATTSVVGCKVTDEPSGCVTDYGC